MITNGGLQCGRFNRAFYYWVMGIFSDKADEVFEQMDTRV